jgi:DNA end-binding protein Ku
MAKRSQTPKRSADKSDPGWKGSLKLSLITIPIRVVPATRKADVSFHQLHRKCKTPIQMKKWCPHCDEEVTADDLVKGYESSKGRYVLAEEEDIKKVRPKSTHVVDISHVLTQTAIDPIYIERTYYVLPASETSGSPFAVVREGLGENAAVGRVAIWGREYLVAIVPQDKILLMHTLRTSGEVRSSSSLSGLSFTRSRPAPAEVKLAKQVLNSFPSEGDISAFTDHYQEALRKMLASKAEEESVDVEDVPAKRGKSNVVPLMDALRKSLENARAANRGGSSGRKTARKKARVIKHTGARKKAS